MPETGSPFAELRRLLLADELVRAVASGRRRGAEARWRRAELRYVDLKTGRRLQVTTYDETQAHTTNHEDAAVAIDGLLDEPFANWHVETTTEVHQLRLTRKQRLLHHSSARDSAVEPDRAHDRAKQRLLAPGHPVLRALGLADERGRIKPSRQAKYRQVEEFLRDLDATLDDAWAGGHLRRPDADHPLRLVDLGCGNAYLTFAAQAHLAEQGIPAQLTGVDVKDQSRRHNSALAEELGFAERMEFVAGSIDDVLLSDHPEVVLALHACDTATDDALARAVGWAAEVVLAAPCCHHDIAEQLRRSTPPPGHAPMLRDGILRERLADTLTDALRASLLRSVGYRVDVVEFVPSRHTPRNTLLRAVRTEAPGSEARSEYQRLTDSWGLRPKLGELLDSGPR